MKNTIKLAFLALGLIFALNSAAFAQEAQAASPETTQAVNLDENIQPADLGVGAPRILPDSPFYPLKSLVRGIQSALTFNPVAKAELRLKFVNEKLIEAKKLAENKSEVFPEAMENYKAETEKLKEAVEKIQPDSNNLEVGKFVDNFVDGTIKQQKLFGKFEKEMPAEMYKNIEEIKKENIAKFSDISLKLVSPSVLQGKITNIAETQQGSDFKHFKNIEILQAVEEKVPEAAKPAIRQAIENSLGRLKGDLENLAPEDREKFKDYVDNIGGNETRHLAIMNEFEKEEMPEIIRNEMEKAKERIFQRAENRLKGYEQKQTAGAKEKFLEHLSQEGRMEDLRVLKEMEDNLSPAVVSQILQVKEEIEEKVAERIKKAETQEQQQEFFEEIEEKFHDVRQFEVFKEIEELIPPEKKELYEKMREKAIARMKEEVERAKKAGVEEKAMILERIAGNSPEQIAILEEMRLPVEIISETAKNLSQRAEFIDNPEKLEILRKKIEEGNIKARVEMAEPRFFERIEQKSETLIREVGAEQAERHIQEAYDNIGSVKEVFASLSEEARSRIEKSSFGSLMEAAKKHFENAKNAFNERKFGEAFGQATASLHNSSNARKVIFRIDSVQPVMPPGIIAPQEKPVCVQVIAPAISPEGICKEFPTPCEVPAGWKGVDKCPASASITPGTITIMPAPTTPATGECKSGEIKYYQCPDGASVAKCKCTPEGKWTCLDSPEILCRKTPSIIETEPSQPIADTVAPVISDIAVRDITQVSAKIEWKTNEPASSYVQYGLTDVYEISASGSSFTTEHSVGFFNLSPGTVYHYKITSKDAAGNASVSADQTFTTSGATY